jgi:pimeloyl-ACP methyl ester carboxylesterase
MKVSALVLSVLVLIPCLAVPVLASKHAGTVLSPDSVSISYSIEGTGAPALVFVHCWCCDRTYWKHQAPQFSKDYTVVTIDLAGHGESALGRDDWTIKAFAEDVAAVVRELDLERTILIGHSMGGPVVLEAAVLLADRMLGVIGIDTYQDFGRTFPEEMREPFFAPFEKDFSGATDRFVRSMFPADADSALVEWIAADMSSAPSEVGLGAMQSMLGFDPAVPIKDIAVPIQAVNAELFPTNVEGNKTLVPSFTVKLMPGLGHFMMLEDPDGFNALLGEAVREIIAAK